MNKNVLPDIYSLVKALAVPAAKLSIRIDQSKMTVEWTYSGDSQITTSHYTITETEINTVKDPSVLLDKLGALRDSFIKAIKKDGYTGEQKPAPKAS